MINRLHLNILAKAARTDYAVKYSSLSESLKFNISEGSIDFALKMEEESRPITKSRKLRGKIFRPNWKRIK